MTKQKLKILLIILLLLPTIGCFGSVKKAFIFPEEPLFWAASPDGEKIVYYSSEGDVYLKKINSPSQPKLVFKDFLGSAHPTGVVWSPDSNKVFLGKANNGRKWYLYDLVTEQIITNYQGFPAIWSPNSKTYAWGVVNKKSVKYYLSDVRNEIQPKRLAVKYDLAPIEFSPDGEKLLVDFRTENNHLITGFIDIKSFELKIIGRFSMTPTWSLNGEYVVYNVVDGDDEGLWIMETEGGRRSKISNLSGSNFVWSPDNSKIAFLESGLHIVDLKEKSLSSFSKRKMPETAVGFGENSQKWSSDGKYLYAMYEETRYLFGKSLTTLVKLDSKGKIVSKKVLKGHPELSLDVHWANDGKKLLYRSKEEDNTIYELKVE